MIAFDSSALTFQGFTSDDWWTLVTAVVCSVACAIPGCFLVLRRMSLLGDALSHAILPGIALAFILTGSRDITPMLLGAFVAALFTAALANCLQRWGRIPEDSALGVTFTTLFALGIVLMSGAARNVDLDPGCVLYGSLEFVSFDRVSVAGIEVPRVLVSLAVVLAATLALLLLFFKELTLVSFDAMLARSLGFSPTFITTVFLMLVSTTIVASFEAVGSILVITMLVAPAATAHLLTDRLKPLIVIAAFAAAGSASLGYVGAVAFNTSVAGMISCAAYLTFLFALFFGPRYGIVPRLFQRWFRRMRVAEEDILGVLFRTEERQGQESALSLQALHTILASSAPRAVSWIALKALTLRSKVSRKGRSEYELSPKGRDAARSIVRGHRLWEAFLDKYLNLPLDHLHEPSHRVEHFITPDLQRILETHVKTEQDPHGRVIPSKKADNDN